MNIYLTNDKNMTIADVEITINSVDVHINIENYSDFLLKNSHMANEIISDFSKIYRIDSLVLEKFFDQDLSLEGIYEETKNILMPIAHKYKLDYSVESKNKKPPVKEVL